MWAAPRRRPSGRRRCCPVGQDGFGWSSASRWPRAPQTLSYIVHRGDEKDLPADQSLDLSANGHEVWLLAATEGYLLPESGRVGRRRRPDQGPGASGSTATTVAWPGRPGGRHAYDSSSAADGSITVDDRGRLGGDYRVIRLAVADGGLTAAAAGEVPAPGGLHGAQVDPRDAARVSEALRGQVVAVERRADGLAADRHRRADSPACSTTLYAGAAGGTRLGPVWRNGTARPSRCGRRPPGRSRWSSTATPPARPHGPCRCAATTPPASGR